MNNNDFLSRKLSDISAARLTKIEALVAKMTIMNRMARLRERLDLTSAQNSIEKYR
jgi:hypothetical protein